MTKDVKKAAEVREFWIRERKSYAAQFAYLTKEDSEDCITGGDEIHVIEKSAYDRLERAYKRAIEQRNTYINLLPISNEKDIALVTINDKELEEILNAK